MWKSRKWVAIDLTDRCQEKCQCGGGQCIVAKYYGDKTVMPVKDMDEPHTHICFKCFLKKVEEQESE